MRYAHVRYDRSLFTNIHVYKDSETIEYVKNKPTFEEIFKFYGQITRQVFGIRMRTCNVIVFIWTQTYRDIFKSALVSLKIEYLVLLMVVN